MSASSDQGFSIVSALIASALVAGSILAINSAMFGSQKSGVKSRAVARQIAVESKLIAGLQDPNQFTAGVQAQMQGGIRPTGWNIQSGGVRIATVGTPVYLTLEGQSCSSGAYGTNSCQLAVELDVKCTTNGFCSAAYRIVVGPLQNGFPIANLGASGKLGDPFIDPADYLTPIPYDLYLGKQSTGRCDSATELAATGLNRDTGELTCLKKPLSSCSPRTFSKGTAYAAPTGSLELACSPPARKLSCPANYTLNQFNPSSLEAGGTPTGTCVFVGVDSINWPSNVAPPAAPSISGTFCPDHYQVAFNSACQVVNKAPVTYTCSSCTCYASCPPCDTHGNCSSCPYECGRQVLSNPLQCSQIASGRTASAQISGPTYTACPNPCGGGTSWSADVRLDGRCDLALPSTVTATPL